MNYDRVLGVGLLIVGTLGIVTTPPAPAPVSAAHGPVLNVLVARSDLAASTLLSPDNVEVRPVPSTEVLPDALTDLRIRDHFRLLLPVQKGQQIVSISRGDE